MLASHTAGIWILPKNASNPEAGSSWYREGSREQAMSLGWGLEERGSHHEWSWDIFWGK